MNLSSTNFDHWYSIAMNFIKLFDLPTYQELDPAASILRAIPELLLQTAKKTFVTEAFKCTSAVILNLLAKSNLIEEHLKDQVRDYLASIFQHIPFPQDRQRSLEKARFMDEIKESEGTMSEIKKPYGLDSFLEICKIQNEKNLCVSICDEFGRFVIIDKIAENIFENKKEVLFKSSLFDLMIPLSFEYLRRKSQKGSLAGIHEPQQEINCEGVFSYTIYSQNAKKKYLKFLNKFHQERRHANRAGHKAAVNQQDSESSIKGIELFYKFMKGLTSRVRRTELRVDRKTLEDLVSDEVNQEYPFLINKKHPIISSILEEKWNREKEFVLDVALLETRVSKHIQNFNYLYMRFDPKIKNQEEKIQNKIRKKLKKQEEDMVLQEAEYQLNQQMKNEFQSFKNEPNQEKPNPQFSRFEEENNQS